jgi:asparagine synthase (glutamine-hydrolysing)
MSIIAGIVRFDDAPIERAVIATIASRIGSRAPDGLESATSSQAAFVFGKTGTGCEDAAQPIDHHDAGITMVFDGRLDNREELIAALGVRASIGDAQLALAAFMAWRHDAAARLLGDFAFAAWESRDRRLTLARDPSGIRPLCYRTGDSWIAFASAVDLLAVIPPAPSPNAGMVGEFLTAFIASTRETVFEGIKRVPPAHQLIASEQRRSLERFWLPDFSKEIRYRRDEDYEEHLRSLLEDSIACRLRGEGRVGVLLSGGVDSSAVTSLAAKRAIDIETFSISVPGSSDEREFFDAVTSHLAVTAHRIEAALPTHHQFRAEIARDLEVQSFPHAPTLNRVRDAVRDRGIRVLLTGMGGDDWLGTSLWAMADLFSSGRWLAVTSRLRQESNAEDFPGWRLAIQSVVWPLLSVDARRAIRERFGFNRPASWIDRPFAARIRLDERLARAKPDAAFRSFEQQDIWQEGTSGTLVHAIESATRGVSWYGIDHRHPFFDRRIVEFGLALPPDQRWRGGAAKHLLRRAVAPHLPEQITRRLTNPSANHALAQAIAAESRIEDVAQWNAVRRGWVRRDELTRMYAEMQSLHARGDRAYGRPAWIVWNVLATSLWLDAATNPAAVV